MCDPILEARTRALIQAALDRPGCPLLAGQDLMEGVRGVAWPLRLLVADVAHQRLVLLADGKVKASYVMSSAKNGTGTEDGSYKTPLGWHRIHASIGDGQPMGMVFKGRVPTGEIWRGEARPDNLITTRILTLEGLEDDYNRGPGRDSLARYIYIHGTNQEASLGTPASKGCLCLSNQDVCDLFERVEAGDPLLILDLPKEALGQLHFVGIAGSGMSALAQFMAQHTHVMGSDRAFDRGQQPERRQQLERLGIQIYPQDGSAISGACTGVVYSTAVEDSVPDFAKAQRSGLPLIHRSALLAYLVSVMRTVAITGTSGKSTTTAMVFEILQGVGMDPSLITGGDLSLLQSQGHWGNAWRGSSNVLVIEADESDGSVVRYQPAVGVVLNLQKDHKEESVVLKMFQTFCGQVKEACIVGEGENLSSLAHRATVFGLNAKCQLVATDVSLQADTATFKVGDCIFHLPLPGKHNVENALAAIGACQALGVPLSTMVHPLRQFHGVARRFQLLGQRRGITVIDDFGHNPAKVAASLLIAQAKAGTGRVLAVYQPHGYGPTRFLWHDFVDSFAAHLRPQDHLYMLEVFYAGGTATRDFSAADVVKDIVGKGAPSTFAPSREWLIDQIAHTAQAGDLVIVMGARDPSLTDLARAILKAL